MNKYGIIYKITNLINGKVYIGQTTEKRGFKGRYDYSGIGIERVFNYHKHFKEVGRSYNSHLYNAIKKYGFEAFEVIEEFDIGYSKEELDELEIKYIKEFNCLNPNGYNDQIGGNTHVITEHTRNKMRANNKGENNPMFGRKHSEETRKKLSENHHDVSKEKNPMYGKRGENNPRYGTKHSEETKHKISEGNKGKIVSEKTKKKLSEGRKGHKNPVAKPVYCEELKDVRLTITEWSRELKIDGRSISRVCNGEYKQTKNYHFRWATEKEVEQYKIKNNIL